MTLEAKSLGRLSAKYSLFRNGKAIGEYQGRWLKGCIDISLSDGRSLQFNNGRLSKVFQLKDRAEGQILGECKSLGFFSGAWEISLSDGVAKVEAKGISDTKYKLVREDKTLAHLSRVNDTSNNWQVQSAGVKTLEDELLVGMLFYTILRRRVANSS